MKWIKAIEWKRGLTTGLYLLFLFFITRAIYLRPEREGRVMSGMDYTNVVLQNTAAYEGYGLTSFSMTRFLAYFLYLVIVFLDMFVTVKEERAYYSFVLSRSSFRKQMVGWFYVNGLRRALISVGRTLGLFWLALLLATAVDPYFSAATVWRVIVPLLTYGLRLVLFMGAMEMLLISLQLMGRSEWGYPGVLVLTAALLLLTNFVPSVPTLTFSEDVTGGWPFALVMLGLNGAAVWLLRRQLKRGELNE